MEAEGRKKSGLASGWILVTGLFLLCLLGTGLTWWNYTRQVFSSADGIVLAPTPLGAGNQGILIAVDLPVRDAGMVRVGHGAIITVGKDTHARKGRVISVNPGKTDQVATVVLRLIEEPEKPKHSSVLPPGTQCSVTIDTTVPPLDELKPAAALP